MISTTLPKINLNGTSAQSLKSEYIDVHHMLTTAKHFLSKATCHGRDFQCNHPDDFNQALFERAEVIAKIDDAQWIQLVESECKGKEKRPYKPDLT